jgi:SIR2-like domain
MGLSELDWGDLLYAVLNEKCTPIVGPETCAPWLPVGAPWLPVDKDIASKWTEGYKYPLEDSYQLSRVAQFLAIKGGSELTPKNLLSREIEELEQKNKPNFSLEKNRNTPHAVLAEFKLPIYITTNYDHLMEHALTDKSKEPVSESCVWNDYLKAKMKSLSAPSTFNKKYKPSVSRPLVYHLHGDRSDPLSMVLTEKDYVDFVIYLSRDIDGALPSAIRTILSQPTLLFIGYKLQDIDFLVIFQGVINLISPQGQRKNIAVQFSSDIGTAESNQVEEYLQQYTNQLFKINVYWGDAYKFSEELRKRWDEYKQTHKKVDSSS